MSAWAQKLDINIIYEASQMKVKETVCGIVPDIENGYMEDENGCFFTRYELDVPMFGFVFEPKTAALSQPVRCAYYISFFDSAVPEKDMVKTAVYKDGKLVREVENLKHERTFQGLILLDKGETLHISTAREPSYTYIYIISVLVVIAGVIFILRRKK